ncbi:PREDICTED: putative nucleolar protein 5-3 [Camelina sativa]|uniref:Nucleolar protein 5-3 n=1 Tax=Camelina sativa TaxID=90675 RepID=A0ABM1QTM3_CAMSA|nr:PREDICTED: putative nucleolar protein 5-3 [Camelina sativa]
MVGALDVARVDSLYCSQSGSIPGIGFCSPTGLWDRGCNIDGNPLFLSWNLSLAGEVESIIIKAIGKLDELDKELNTYTTSLEICDHILALTECRAQLHGILKSRMNTIAPNLTALVGEMVGARLISHRGSLLNLSKLPSCKIQILGSEKALLRAFKNGNNTPKYGLIYHAPLVAQAAPEHKAKISRSLAAKVALAIRCDVHGDGRQGNSMGMQSLLKLEERLRDLQRRGSGHVSDDEEDSKIEEEAKTEEPSKEKGKTEAESQEPTHSVTINYRKMSQNVAICYFYSSHKFVTNCDN